MAKYRKKVHLKGDKYSYLNLTNCGQDALEVPMAATP